MTDLDTTHVTDNVLLVTRFSEALNKLALSIAVTRDEETLLQQGVEILVEALMADHGAYVEFLADDREQMRVRIEYPDHGTIGIILDARNNPLVPTFDQVIGTPVLVADTQADTRVLESAREGFLKLGICAVIVFPLITSGKMIGTISTDLYTTDRQFTPEMAQLGQVIASQLSVGLQNLRLVNDADQRVKQLQNLVAFEEALQGLQGIDETLTAAVLTLPQLLVAERVTLVLRDRASGKFRVAASSLNGAFVAPATRGELVGMNNTLVGRVLEVGEVVIIEDSNEQSGVRHVDDMRVRSVMAAPMRSRGNTIGAIIVAVPQPNAYSSTDAAIFQQLANQLAAATAAAQTLDITQRTARNESIVNDISAELQRTTDLEAMLRITVMQLGSALGARTAHGRLAPIPDSDDDGAPLANGASGMKGSAS